MPALKNVFTPAAGETVTFVAGPSPSIVALPAVDGSNTAVLVTNNGPAEVAILWGLTATQAPLLFGVPGPIIVNPGASILLTGSAASTVTSAAVQMQPPSNGSVTVTRGTASTIWLFDTLNVGVV